MPSSSGAREVRWAIKGTPQRAMEWHLSEGARWFISAISSAAMETRGDQVPATLAGFAPRKSSATPHPRFDCCFDSQHGQHDHSH
jgi:hypothetical protein